MNANRPVFLVALLGVVGSALAHHSRAPFLLDETMQVEGVVTEVNWGNPHLYLEVSVLSDQGGEHLWTFEGHSVPGLAVQDEGHLIRVLLPYDFPFRVLQAVVQTPAAVPAA